MPKKVIAYHKKDGPTELDTLEARRVVTEHPKEWSSKPWSKDQAEAEVNRPDHEVGDVDFSENLPVNRTVETVAGPHGTNTVVIGAGNDEGPPPAPRHGATNTARKRGD